MQVSPHINLCPCQEIRVPTVIHKDETKLDCEKESSIDYITIMQNFESTDKNRISYESTNKF